MATQQCTDWQTVVRCYDASKPGKWKPVSTNIPEKEFCISMPGIPSGPLGRPVDANLAVNLIRDFYANAVAAYGPLKDSEIDKLDVKTLRGLYRAARAFLSNLKDLNYGMTIDKDFALKLLSQPNCEGLRGYLCFKNDQDAPISLVTVGVDADGYDLKYNKTDSVVYQPEGKIPDNSNPPVLPTINQSPAVDTVKMQSLNGEYVTPPFTIQWNDLFENDHLDGESKDFYSRFILLNIALGRKDLVKMAKATT